MSPANRTRKRRTSELVIHRLVIHRLVIQRAPLAGSIWIVTELLPPASRGLSIRRRQDGHRSGGPVPGREQVARGELRVALIAVGRQPVRVAEMSVGQEVTVSGRLDANSAAEVRAALHGILDRGVGDLLVHLAQAEVHDVTGLGVIVGVHHRARTIGRRLVLVDVSPRLDRLLRASRLHRVLARGPGQGLVAVVPSTQAVVPFPQTVAPFTD